VQGGGGVEPAGEGNADLLADGQGFKNYGHTMEPLRVNSEQRRQTFISHSKSQENDFAP
jgi:hypothetical protein